VLFAMVALGGACGGDDPVEPDPAVAPFVGTWQADSLTISALPPDMTVANILGVGGSFFITVESSGQYTASLEILGQSSPEIGQLTVLSGSTLRLTPTTPPGPSVVATYFFARPDSLILDGPTEFDFNNDGTPEDAQAHFELTRD
jgi:hypothetical protein